MSVKNVNELDNTSKILNSDIYDITSFVDDIKKRNIDGVGSRDENGNIINDGKETLAVGMYGYLGYQFSSLLQNAIVTASELSNEAIPTRAKFDRNVITHALSLGVEKVAGTPANMKVLMMFPERAIKANMVNGKFTLYADTKLNFDEFEFHPDYDIEIYYNELYDSNNGSDRHYIYSARYVMDHVNPISDIDNAYLPPIGIYSFVDDNYIVLTTNLHQVYYKEIVQKIVGTDEIANKTISFSFENQMSHFFVNVEEIIDGVTTITKLIPVYDGLYSQEQAENKYCYYQYINSNTIRIRFDPASYQPRTNADVKIQLFTTSGSAGNFEYTEDKTIQLTSNQYTNLFTIIKQRGDDGSSGGIDRQSIEELQRIIPKEALSRGSITTVTDLQNYFNSLNNENSVLHVFREEDNILNRIYYTYNLMKDQDMNIVPTNTIPIYTEADESDIGSKQYIESGTPLYYYQYGEGADVSIIRDNYIGYESTKAIDHTTEYSIYNINIDNTLYQGTPTFETLELWNRTCQEELDPENYITMEYVAGKTPPKNCYDFHNLANVNFKPAYYNGSKPEDRSLYNRHFYGTIRNGNHESGLYRVEIPFSKMYNEFIMPYSNIEDDGTVVNKPNQKRSVFEVTIYKNNTVYHIPRRDSDTSRYTDFSVEKLIEDSQYITNIKYFRKDPSNTVFADECSFDVKVNTRSITAYACILVLEFYDEGKSMAKNEAEKEVEPYDSTIRRFIIPGYLQDTRKFSKRQMDDYITDIMNIFASITFGYSLVLESINNIDCYAYDGQGEYTFAKMKLTEGDIIRFTRYKNETGDYSYEDPSTWDLGEVLSVSKNNGLITSIEILQKDTVAGEFVNNRYTIPSPGTVLDEECITHIFKITKFVYTTPFSIVLKDDPKISSHRITAAYYLDIINETRYQEFKCINSKSPIQYVLSFIKTYRSSYLSDSRYKYNISINITPNTGAITKEMINRTQVIGVLYKNGNPIIYSIADYTGPNDGHTLPDTSIPYEINLYTKPFCKDEEVVIDSNGYEERTVIDTIDNDNCTYIGTRELIKDLKANSENPEQDFFDQYHVYYTTGRGGDWSRPINMPVGFDLDNLPMYYAKSVYLDLNTEMKIYILYKYDTVDTSKYYDDAARLYMSTNAINVDALKNSVPSNTRFEEVIPCDDPEKDPEYVAPYTLNDMVLTNVYNTVDGINLLYDYSNLMNSYVTMIETNDLFNPFNNKIHSYIINRVPCIRYFYWWNEQKVLQFIKEVKKKINYVIDAIDPLEATFGLDFKFFNTYGPSKMYHVTDDDGNVAELIDNVALTMTFRTRFYNDSDIDSITARIKDRIKSYLEKLDQLDDIHFPNITTEIEREFGEYITYFEFISFNIFDANHQHIITNESMEMLTSVPEFLHVDMNDFSTNPFINIRVVNN